MKFSLLNLLKKTKQVSFDVANLTDVQKKKILFDLAKTLLENRAKILYANKVDIEKAHKNQKNNAFIDRLTLSEKIFTNMIVQVKNIAKQKDYSGEVIERKIIANGVVLQKIRVPLGVIGIIYESRPNVTIDVAALCIKSGNAVILRGGSEAYYTNKILVDCIYQSLQKNNITKDIVGFVESINRDLVTQMLKEEKYIDVIIPRGGYDLVKKVVSESKIPVLYHASGGARIYVDTSADIDLAVKVCVNAKISRPATCNSLDTILVHKNIAKEFLEKFATVLNGRAEMRADTISEKILRFAQNDKIKIKKVTKEDYETEFLDYVLSVKVVESAEDGVSFIQKHTNKHSEGIISQDKKAITMFTHAIDAAALFVNCSTRLHDGGMFELGAEMGIATGKLHVRGPVGAKELTTYKWIATGSGQIRE